MQEWVSAMSLPHQCPKCELRFTWVTELDDHCRSEHPEFHHDYPAQAHAEEPEPKHAADTARNPMSASGIVATYWNER